MRRAARPGALRAVRRVQRREVLHRLRARTPLHRALRDERLHRGALRARRARGCRRRAFRRAGVSAYAVMWSGGKDSALALWRARQRGLEIRWLLTVYDAATRRVRFHATPIAASAAQTRAAALELVAVPTTWEGFDLALTTALAALTRAGCTGLVFGDI